MSVIRSLLLLDVNQRRSQLWKAVYHCLATVALRTSATKLRSPLVVALRSRFSFSLLRKSVKSWLAVSTIAASALHTRKGQRSKSFFLFSFRSWLTTLATSTWST